MNTVAETGPAPAPAAAAASAPTPTSARTAVAPLRVLELAAVALSLLYALVFWLRLPSALPSEQDYLALQKVLQSEVRGGDAIAVLPYWAERIKMYVHGTPVLALPSLENQLDAERYQRLWVVAQPKLPHSDAADTLARLSQRMVVAGPVRSFGPLELWLFTPKEGRAATFDFVAHAGDAQIQSNGQVQLSWREFDFVPRRCLFIGGQAEVHFNGATVSHGLRVGIGGGVAQVVASVDGRPLPAFQLAQGGQSFQQFERPVDGLTPGEHQVDFAVMGRGVCLDAVAF